MTNQDRLNQQLTDDRGLGERVACHLDSQDGRIDPAWAELAVWQLIHRAELRSRPAVARRQDVRLARHFAA